MDIGSLIIKIGSDIKGFNDGVKEVEGGFAKMAGLGTKLSAVGKDMSLYVTAPLMALGAGALAVAKDFDNAYDAIRIGTGATGEALEDLNANFRNVLGRVPADAATAANAIADINTRLGLTGEPLEALGTQFLALAEITGGDVQQSITSMSRAFGDWGVETEAMGDKMDFLFKVSQSTGIGVDALAGKVVQFGAPLRQMGFSLEEAAAMFGKFEKEGVNAELVMGSLRIALAKFSAEGVADVPAALEAVTEAIKGAGSAGEANTLAIETFGARAGPDMAAAIREGRFEIGELMDALNNSEETIIGAAEETRSFAETWQVFKNNLLLAIEPLGTALMVALDGLLKLLMPVINAVGALGDWFRGLGDTGQQVVLVIGGIAAAIGPFLMALGKIMTLVGTSAAGGGLVSALATMKAGLAALVSPVGLVVAAVAALVAGGVLLYNNWNTLSNWFKTTFAGALGAVAGAWDSIRLAVGSAWDGIKNVWDEIKKTFAQVFGGTGYGMGRALEVLGQAWDVTSQKIQSTIGFLVSAVSNTFGSLVSIIGGVVSGVANVIAAFLAALRGDWSGAWDYLKQAATAIWDALVTVVLNAVDTLLAGVGALVSIFPSMGEKVDGLREKIRGMVPQKALDDTGALAGGLEAGGAAAVGLGDESVAAGGELAKLAEAGAGAGAGVVAGMESAAGAVQSLSEQVAGIIGTLGEQTAQGERILAFRLELTEQARLKNEISELEKALTALAKDTTISIDDQRVKDLQTALTDARTKLDDVNKADMFKQGLEKALDDLASKAEGITEDEVASLQETIDELGTQAKTSEDFKALIALQSSLDNAASASTTAKQGMEDFFALAADDMKKFEALNNFETKLSDIDGMLTGEDALQAKITAVWTAYSEGALSLEEAEAYVDSFNDEFERSKNLGKDIITGVTAMVSSAFPNLGRALGSAAGAVEDFKSAFKADNGKPFLENIGNGFFGVADAINSTKGFMSQFGDVSGAILGGLSAAVPGLGTAITGLSAVFEALGIDVSGALNAISDSVAKLLGLGGGGSGGPMQQVFAMLSQMRAGLLEKVQELGGVWEALAPSTTTLQDAIAGAANYEEFIENLSEKIGLAVDQTAALFTKQQELAIKNTAFAGQYDPETGQSAAVSDELKQQILSLLNDLLSSGNFTNEEIWEILKAQFGKTPLITLGIAQQLGVPALAQGGLAFGSTLALLGEYAGAAANPEVIAPLDKLVGIIKPLVGGAGDGVIQIYLDMDGERVAEVVTARQQRIYARLGLT